MQHGLHAVGIRCKRQVLPYCDAQTLCGLPFCADRRLDEIAFHFSFTYYSMLGGGQGPNGLNQLAALYLDHSVSAAAQYSNMS